MAIQLPNENPEWIYEGYDANLYEDATGRILNRAPKQVQENVEYLAGQLDTTINKLNSINLTGDGAIMDNRRAIHTVQSDIVSGTRIPLPTGMTVEETTQDIVITDVVSGKHYYKPFHFSVLDSRTLASKTNIVRGTKLLFRVWNKRVKSVRTLLDHTTVAGKKIPVPTHLDFVPTVHELIIQLDGVTQREYTYEDGYVSFKFDITQGQELIFLSI